MGGSLKEAQDEFLKMVGLLEPHYKYTEEVLSTEEAVVLSSALDHQYFNRARGEDKYFTMKEYMKMKENIADISIKFVEKGEAVSGDMPRADVLDLTAQFREQACMCMCPAHNLFRSGKHQDFCSQLGELIMTPPVLSDHFGTEVACALLPTLLKKAQIDMSVRVCGAGSPYAVNFILQMPSGYSYHFVGHPDFTVTMKPKGCLLRFTLKGLGEVQSPPGLGEESKTAALSQAGIYAVGQFGNGWTGTFLPAVVLHKDKSAQVAVAVLDRSNVTADNSIGKALFKFVERVEALNLKDPEELSVFARCFCGAMKVAQVSSQ